VQVCQWIEEREREREEGEKERGIDQPRRQISPDDFHFQRTNYSARYSVRSFVRLFLPLLQIEARSEMRAFGLDGKSQQHLNF